MHTATGHPFDLVKNNFAELFNKSKLFEIEETGTEFVKQFPHEFSKTFDNPNLFVTGSETEGAKFSAMDATTEGCRKIDGDVMFNLFGESFSIENQVNFIKDVPGAPGHVMLDVTEDALRHPLWNSVTTELNGRKFISAFKYKCLAEAEISFMGPKDEKDSEGKACLTYDAVPGISKLLIKFSEIKKSMSQEEVIEARERWAEIFGCKTDLVPCIACEFWPSKQAGEWLGRKRLWPPEEVVCKIKTGGYHLVPKASLGGNTDLEWRVSFSMAEKNLAEIRTPIQRKCFHILKTLHQSSQSCTGVVTTYHLKTVMMWAMETYPPEYWRHDKLAQCVLGLLDKLLHAVSAGYLPHYFIPQCNLFQHRNPTILAEEARNLSKLITNIVIVCSRLPALPVVHEAFEALEQIGGKEGARLIFKHFIGLEWLLEKSLPGGLDLWDQLTEKAKLKGTNITDELSNMLMEGLFSDNSATNQRPPSKDGENTEKFLKELKLHVHDIFDDIKAVWNEIDPDFANSSTQERSERKINERNNPDPKINAEITENTQKKLFHSGLSTMSLLLNHLAQEFQDYVNKSTMNCGRTENQKPVEVDESETQSIQDLELD